MDSILKRGALVLLLAASVWSLGAEEPGLIELYLFDQLGLPLGEAELFSETGTLLGQSSPSGFLRLSLPGGAHTLSARKAGVELGLIRLRAEPGRTQEILARLDGSSLDERGGDSLSGAAGTGPGRPAPGLAPGEPAPPLPPEGPPGRLSGRVTQLENGRPLSGVTVLIRGQSQEGRSDAEGRFSLELPQGTYTVSFLHPDSSTQTRDGVVIAPEQATELAVELTPAAVQLGALRVFSANEAVIEGGLVSLVEETRNSGVVLNLIGVEQISRSGDGDAAQALSRVTGLTVVDGKYVFVRGMGERYASSAMNGARLPSPETDRRVVPLDLFPTAVLESLAIQKTYSPDLYGDFSGGVVTLRTLGLPQDRFQRRLRGSTSLGLGFDPTLLFQTLWMSPGGRWDWLGFDDGTRGLPETIRQLPAPLQPINPISGQGQSQEELLAAARSFAPTWGLVPVTAWPDLSVTQTWRDKWDFGPDQELGWSLAWLYKSGYDQTNGQFREWSDPEATDLEYDYDTVVNTRNIDLGSLFTVQGRWNRDSLAESTTFVTRLTEQADSETRGFNEEAAGEALLYDRSWIEQTLLNQRLALRSRVSWPFTLDPALQYSFSWARRDEPDHKYLAYREYPEGYFTNDRVGRPYRLYSEVQDFIHDLQLKAGIPLSAWGQATDSLELGGHFIRQDRSAQTRRFSFRISPDSDLLPEDLFAPENIGVTNTARIRFFESTLSTDSYKASHTVWAGYLSADFTLGGWLRTQAGLRYESSLQEVFTFDLFSGSGQATRLSTWDLLPSLNLTLPLGSDSRQLRLGFSRTVNRPDLRELSAAPKDGLPGQGQFVGNPQLDSAEILNFDLRYEQYLTQTESWSLGLFYKSFTDAIETSRIAGATRTTSLINIPEASNFGVELEWNLSLSALAEALSGGLAGPRQETLEGFYFRRFWGGVLGNVLRDFSTSGNLSWIQSEINYAGEGKGVLTSDRRPLQGQSPYVVNLSLSYKNSQSWRPDAKSDSSVTVNYNLFGPRLRSLGIYGFPDSYEQPFHQLDLVLRHRLDESWSFDAKLRNLLDLPSVESANGVVLEEVRKGRNISLGVKYEW